MHSKFFFCCTIGIIIFDLHGMEAARGQKHYSLKTMFSSSHSTISRILKPRLYFYFLIYFQTSVLRMCNGEMDLQLCNNYTLTDYILSDLPILGDFFRMGLLFFLAGSFSVLLPLSTFTWQIEEERWINKQTRINVFWLSSLSRFWCGSCCKFFKWSLISQWKMDGN